MVERIDEDLRDESTEIEDVVVEDLEHLWIDIGGEG